jgi:hypothetical protein
MILVQVKLTATVHYITHLMLSTASWNSASRDIVWIGQISEIEWGNDAKCWWGHINYSFGIASFTRTTTDLLLLGGIIKDTYLMTKKSTSSYYTVLDLTFASCPSWYFFHNVTYSAKRPQQKTGKAFTVRYILRMSKLNAQCPISPCFGTCETSFVLG